MEVITDGFHYLISDNSGNKRLIKIRANKKIKHFKAFIDPTNLLNLPVGSYFVITDSKKGLCKIVDNYLEILPQEEQEEFE